MLTFLQNIELFQIYIQMKKKLIALLLLMFTMHSICAQYVLIGEFVGIPDGHQIELIPGATHKEEKPEMVAVVNQGQFTFSGDLLQPRLYYLRVKDYQGVYKVFIDKGDIRITGNVELIESGNSKRAIFKNVIVSGSETDRQYREKIAFRDNLNKIYEDFHANNQEISELIREARAAKDVTKVDSLLNTEAGLQLQKDEKAFFESVKSFYKKAFEDNKDSWWGPFLQLDLMSYFGEDDVTIFNSFSDEAKKSYYGQIAQKEIFPKNLAGEIAPDFSITTDTHGTVTLGELIKDKRYILVDFWASWCAPCRKEIPHLKEIYAEYENKGFEIISISIDGDTEAWKEALHKEEMKWPNFLDSTKDIRTLYNVRTIPATFLLNDKGEIIMEKVKSKELLEQLKILLPS